MTDCHLTVRQIQLLSYRCYQGQLARGKVSFVTAFPKYNRFLSFEKWNHVASDENPADICSRGVPADKTANNSL